MSAVEPPRARTTRIAVALFDGVEELDFARPWEVLALWAQAWPGDEVEVFTVADSSEPITCAKGLRVLPYRTWDFLDKVDVLVYLVRGLDSSSSTSSAAKQPGSTRRKCRDMAYRPTSVGT